MGNQRHCYALTIIDNLSRYLLLWQALERPSYAAVRPWFEWVFRQYGFRQAIRADNGAPFASRSAESVSCRDSRQPLLGLATSVPEQTAAHWVWLRDDC